MRLHLLVLVVLPVATACGSQREATAPGRVSDAMEKAGTSRVEMTVPYGSRSKSAVLRYSGVFDYQRRRGRMQLASSASTDRNAFPPVEIDIGGSSYWPLTVMGKERWYQLDTGSANSNFPGPLIPDRILATFSRASEDIERLDKDVIRGVPTTRYRIKLTTAQEMSLGTFSPIDVWIDDQGLARRVEWPGGTDLSVTVDFFDFGVPVDVKAPSASKLLTDKDVDADCARRTQEGLPSDVWWCAA